MSTLQKECADFLRSMYADLPGGKLRSGHAHEIVAAYFGYGSAAALRTEGEDESTYPLADLGDADILIPDLRLMDRRLPQLSDLPAGLPNARELARRLSDFLKKARLFGGEVWLTNDIGDFLASDFVFQHEYFARIEDALSSEIAVTNAYFDELLVEETEVAVDEDNLSATLSGTYYGEQDPDKMFYGDRISFTIEMTCERVAGRVGYARPDLEISGELDHSEYEIESAT